MGKLSDKVAVITGGSSGIGLATAQRFVAEDAYVFHHRPATDRAGRLQPQHQQRSQERSDHALESFPKTVLLIGASRGLGLAMVAEFLL